MLGRWEKLSIFYALFLATQPTSSPPFGVINRHRSTQIAVLSKVYIHREYYAELCKLQGAIG